MSLKSLIFSVAWVGLTGCVFGDKGRDGSMTEQDLIRGVVARAEVIFSGEIDYRQKSGFVGNHEKNPEGKYKAIFSGSSWRVYSKYVASEVPISHHPGWRLTKNEPQLEGFLEITELSHNGKTVKYNMAPQADKSIRHSANITRETTINYLSGTYNAPPVFAGSFWFDCMKQFIQNHKDRAVRLSDSEVNGVKSQVLE